MTTTSLHTPTGLATSDAEGHGNVYAKEPRMELQQQMLAGASISVQKSSMVDWRCLDS